MAGGVVGYNSERGPPKDHPCQVWSKLAQWFQRRRLKCEKLTDRQTDGRTTTTTDNGRFMVAIAHTGELKMVKVPFFSIFYPVFSLYKQEIDV